MRTKLYYLLLLCLMVLGRGEVWAETTTITLTSGQAVCPMVADGSFTFTPDKGTGSNAPNFNTTTGKSGMCFNSGNTLTISSSFLTITNISVQFTKDGDEDNIRSGNIKNLRIDTNDGTSWAKIFTNKSYSGNSNGLFNLTLSPVRSSFVFTFNKIDASGNDPYIYIASITITYTDNRSTLTEFAFNSDEVYIHNGSGSGGTYVNGTTFVYDANKTTLRTKLNIDPALSTIGASANSTYFSVTSSNPAVLNVSGTLSYSSADGGTRVYIDGIQVAGIGNTTLTFTFAGSSTYKNTSIDVPINVIDHSITPYSGTYRYTWDFAGGDWASTIAQLGYGNGTGGHNWTKTVDESHAEARPTYHNWIPSYSGIDMIAGLEFNLTDKADLCLDWFEGRKAIWMNTNATVIIPSLVAGQTITITADNNNYIIDAGTATKSGNVITVTGDGNVTLKMAQATRISSIAVSNSQYGWSYTTTTTMLDKERPTSGTFTFTEPGPITGGNEINEVPGITLTVGASGDTWEVVDATALDGSYPLGAAAAYCATAPNNARGATAGCFYNFEALVNGEVTVNYYTVNGASAIDIIKSGQPEVGKNTSNRIQTLTFSVEAGKTYQVHTSKDGTLGSLWLKSFTFTPKFFSNGTTTPQLTIGDFDANMNTDKGAFPKLINPSSTTQQNKVKFAGDKSVVFLYKNNDVDLLGYGQNVLIRGTVLDKNNEDGLVAYYYLNSNVLNVTEYELADQAYIGTDGLGDGQYYIKFSGAIKSVANSTATTVTIQVKKDNESVQNVAATITGEYLYVPFATLEKGSTYRMTIPAEVIALSSETEATTKNTEIIRTFSVTNFAEPPITMVWPVDLAEVGDPIVLQTNVINANKGTQVDIDKNFQVTGTLKVAGEENGIEITANIVGNRLVFKPKQPLANNTVYTLDIPASNYNQGYAESGRIPSDKSVSAGTKGVIMAQNQKESTEAGGETNERRVLKHAKSFTFKTTTSSGTIPEMTGSSPYHLQDQGISYSGGTISVSFNQAVKITPYSTIYATPVNGSEATTTASTALEGEASDLSVSDRTISFDYVADGLKYDLWYEVLIPKNTIRGSGGKPNTEEFKFRFKMNRNPNSTEVTPESFYPHTWDFCKLGSADIATSTYSLIKSNTNENYYDQKDNEEKKLNPIYARTNALMYVKETDGGIEYRTKDATGYEYMQGADVKIATSASTLSEQLPEFEGIRLSFTDARTKRFALRNLTQTDIVGGKSTENAQKNADGTDKWIFRMNGNTHYMTLSKVPAGKLYMVVNAPHLGINSPNAVFESVSGSGYELSNENTLLNTHGTKKVVINVTPQNGEEYEDVSFCVQNFSCEKIGVAEDEKTFNANFAESGKTYATDRLTYDVRYDLLNAFTNHNVKAYYVSSIADNPSDNTGTITATEVPLTVAKSNQGVMVLYQSALSNNTTVPIFKTDVNSPATSIGETYNGATVANQLKVISSGSTELPSIENNYYMYVLSNRGSKSEGVAFYRYTGSSFSDRAAYLEVPKYMVNPSISGGSARAFRMVFYNEDGSETTVIRTVEKDGVTEKAEQAGGYYDLRGQRLTKPNKRGLYIKDGKKVYVK